MTSLSKLNYPVEIGHSPEEEGAFDEEKINFSPSSLSQLQDDSICFSNSVEDKDDDTAEDEEGEADNKKKKTGTGKLVCTILAGIAAITTAVVAGVSVSSSNRRAQSQLSTSLLADPSKAGKAAPYCAPQITCGQTFTDEVTLTEDLVCDDDIQPASNSVKRAKNCAITLDGDDAELDCNGFAVFQESSNGNDAAVTCPSDTTKEEKTTCDLYYYRGICLKGNAKAKNCQGVENFIQGFHVEGGGEIEDALVSRNRIGIRVDDGLGDTTKISKS